MKTRRLTLLWLASALVAGLASTASATTKLTGSDAVSAFFNPNMTQPDLALGGGGSVENSGGVAIFDKTSFVMNLDFLNNGPPGFYENIILTAALDSSVDYAGVVVSVSFGGST